MNLFILLRYTIALSVVITISIFANDDYFEFPNQSLPEKVEFETTRKLCLFPFRNTKENEKFSYLSNGIPSVIISNLNGFKYVFDRDVLETVVYHAFGDPKKIPPNNSKKPQLNKKYLHELNSEVKEVLPEKDPRYIILELEFVQMETTPLREESLELGRKNKCFYVMTGEFATGEDDNLEINIEFTNRKNGKVEKLSESTSLRRAYQEMSPLGMKIKKLLFNKELTSLQIETVEETDALIFVDGHYAGKTPLEKNDIATGKHEVTITKDGFETLNRVINVKKDSNSKYSFTLKKLEKKGLLSVTSNPSGASVYLGITYLGETPLHNVVVPLGQNRIRIEKEDHIDYYSSVEIEKGKPYIVNAKLKEGKTEDYYKNRLKVFLDYTYFDFSQYSVYSVILFYASYQYWNYRVNAHKDLIRGDPRQGGVIGDMALFTTYYTYFSGSNPDSLENLAILYSYQKVLVGKNETKADEFRRYRDASGVGMVSMLAIAGVFYYFGVDNDAFEFALSPIAPNPTSSSSIGTAAVFESYFRFNFKF